jgi:hypothetical protein
MANKKVISNTEQGIMNDEVRPNDNNPQQNQPVTKNHEERKVTSQ